VKGAVGLRRPAARLRLAGSAVGQYESVSDLLQDAVAELYAADPDWFIARRDELAAAARSAGQAAAARQIAGLRKPTRAAWMVNLLARREQDLVAGLNELGGQLRAAQRSLDGERIRELSGRRRALVDELTRRAVAVSGEHGAPAALRDEVSATFGAALADPDVAEQVTAGRLVRAVRREGFGEPGTVPLLVVPPARAPVAARKPAREAARKPAREAARKPAREAARKPAREAAGGRSRQAIEARAREVRERHRAALAAAEQAAADARRELDAAVAARDEQQDAIRDLQTRLAQARRALAEATRKVRVAQAVERGAVGELDKLRRRPLSISSPPG
jgi:hypothetical protein